MDHPAVSIARGPTVRPSPRVSVVIPAYGGDWLDEALDSVRAQSFDDWEMVLIDDGSPAPLAPARADDLVLVRQPNAGPGGARNRGFALARGEYVALLDADDRWLPDKLARQVAFLDERPGYVMACTDFRPFGGRAARPSPTVRERGGSDGDRIRFERLFYENCICPSTVIMRREALARTAGMAPHRRIGEDYGLWLRLALLGPVGYLAEVLIERRLHPGSLMHESLRDGSWLAEERELYREFLVEHPELRRRRFVAAALGRLEFQGGWHHLQRREWDAARRALLRSIGHDLRRPKAWLNLARALLHVPPRR